MSPIWKEKKINHLWMGTHNFAVNLSFTRRVFAVKGGCHPDELQIQWTLTNMSLYTFVSTWTNKNAFQYDAYRPQQ